MRLHAEERYGDAATCYAGLRESSREVMPWALYQADVELSRHDLPAAANFLRQSLKASPDYVPARIQLAFVLAETGENMEALGLIDDLLREAPESVRVQYLAGKLRRSLPHLKEAVRIAPRFGQAHYELALALRRAGETKAAEEHFRLFRLYSKNTVETPDPLLDQVRRLKQIASDHLLAGRRYEAGGDIESARASYELARAADPKLVQAHINLIGVYGRLNSHDKAAKSFHAAVTLDAGAAEAYYNYGVALASQNRLEEAETRFGQAVDLNGYYADALNNLGYLLQKRGQLAEAEARFRAAVACQPAHRDAHFNLARLLSSAGKADADIHFRKAQALEDDRTAAYVYYFAGHLHRTGRPSEALAQARRALELAEKYGQGDLASRIRALIDQWSR